MKTVITIKQIKNEQRPDLPFRWKVRHRAGTTSSCAKSEEAAASEAVDAALSEMLWWARYRRTQNDAS